MSRIIHIGEDTFETNWDQALASLQIDDVLILKPGFYQLPKDIVFKDITIKGTGSNPEDTVILGYIGLKQDAKYLNLENLCLKNLTEHNALFIPTMADAFLTLRNCVLHVNKGDIAAIAINGKSTVELYSSKIIGGSISFFKTADFRLEMNDSLIDYYSDEYCALALEGHGTAVINNSKIIGSLNTFSNSNVEINLNNSVISFVILHGQTWLNMLNVKILDKSDSCFMAGDDSWINLIESTFAGGIYLDKNVKVIMQNCQADRLIAVNKADLTIQNSIFISHADFQDEVNCYADQVTFNGTYEFEYYLAMSGNARLIGKNLILNSNTAIIAILDNAKINVQVLHSDQDPLILKCDHSSNIKITSWNWKQADD